MKRGRRLPPEARAVFEAARRSEASAPRKHHVVPASYLRRWAEEGQVRVTDLDARRTYAAAPDRVARITDFYRVEADGIPPDEVPPLLIETMLAAFEGLTVKIIDFLLASPRCLDVKPLTDLAWYLALQFTRGETNRAEQRYLATEFYRTEYGSLTDEGIREHLRRRGVEPTPELLASSREFIDGLKDGSITAEPGRERMIRQALIAAEELGLHLLDRAWLIYKTSRILITSDNPVVPIGGPGVFRDQRAGLANADAVMFPLAPDRLLVMVPSEAAQALGMPPHPIKGIAYDELSPGETIDVCRELAMNAHRWVFERPSKRVGMRLNIPEAVEAGAVEELGPTVGADGEEGVLVRYYRPNRWVNERLPRHRVLPRWVRELDLFNAPLVGSRRDAAPAQHCQDDR